MFHVVTGDSWSAADEDEISDLARLWLGAAFWRGLLLVRGA
jgi:hypothetical protein